MPVPVHTRTPRVYSVDVFETPANCNYDKDKQHPRKRSCDRAATNLELPCPQILGWVHEETPGEISLYAADQVVAIRAGALTAKTDMIRSCH